MPETPQQTALKQRLLEIRDSYFTNGSEGYNLIDRLTKKDSGSLNYRYVLLNFLTFLTDHQIIAFSRLAPGIQKLVWTFVRRVKANGDLVRKGSVVSPAQQAANIARIAQGTNDFESNEKVSKFSEDTRGNNANRPSYLSGFKRS